MNLDDYIARMKWFENKINSHVHSFADINNQMLQVSMPMLEAQNSILQSIQPLIDYQEQLSNIIKNTVNLPDIAITINPYMENIISIQQGIATRLANLQLDVSNAYISSDSSARFDQVVEDLINDFDDIEMPESITPNLESQVHTSSKSGLTWEQILTIIGFLISVISFIQSQMPNAQLSAIESKMNKLIEIQMDEINSLDDTPNQ